MIKILILLSSLIFSSIAIANGPYDPYPGGNSCDVSPRKVRCWDMSTNPSSYQTIEINGCSASCPSQYRPICLPGALMGNNCSDWVEASRCYCGNW